MKGELDDILDCSSTNDVSVELASSSRAATLSLVEERTTSVFDEESSEDDNEHNLHGQLRIRAKSIWIELSNGFFFLGSVMYVVTATISLVEAYQDYDDEDDDGATLFLSVDDETGDDDDDYDQDDPEPFWNAYKILASVAALLYLGNALFDGRVAVAETRQKVGRTRFGDDPRWEIGVAVTFGVAALCDFVSELIWDESNMWPGYAAGCAAVDTYLLNAVLVVSGRRPAFTSTPQTLMSAGDILFLIGSIIDVLISFIDNPDAPSSRSIEIAWSSWVSSALWFIDAVLYILADRLSRDESYSSIVGSSSDDDESGSSEVEISSWTTTPIISRGSEDMLAVDKRVETNERIHNRTHRHTTEPTA